VRSGNLGPTHLRPKVWSFRLLFTLEICYQYLQGDFLERSWYSMATPPTPMASALQTVDLVRQNANRQLDPKRKSALGQFMTPSVVARYMASLFEATPKETIRVLDPSAGVGSLTAAFLRGGGGSKRGIRRADRVRFPRVCAAWLRLRGCSPSCLCFCRLAGLA
jgi:hypothetical protein